MDLQFTATLASGVTASGSYYLNDNIGGAALTSDFTVTLFDVAADFTGTAGSDVVFGSAQADKLRGGEGNDFLIGGAGDDTLAGGDGDDVLSDGEGSNYISGGLGRDTVSYADSPTRMWIQLMDLWGHGQNGVFDHYNSIENLIGSKYNDTLMGNDGANLIVGGGGVDSMRGLGGNDTIIGGNIANVMQGEGGNDVLIGGSGVNSFFGGEGADKIYGGAGNDSASYYGAATGVIVSLVDQSINTGEAAGDTLVSIEDLSGSDYTDTLYGDGNANRLYGGGGDDTLFGNAADDTLIGSSGDDILCGGAGADALWGIENSGGDTGGNDTASYQTATARVVASLQNSANNTGDAAGDKYSRIDNLLGSDNGDSLAGNGFGNVIDGGAGNDTLRGYGGNDKLIGGGGQDIFVFSSVLSASANVETIADFNAADDTIRLEARVFSVLPAGTLAATAFRANASGTAGDADDRIIYNSATGGLFYDEDGNGAAVAVQFAKLTGVPSISAADFVVV
ncbi:hypothetical protein [Mesorhizobium sp. IMUNJ 23232]|uniref:hypothetical protein n=1 Tax=Mesorhizobium sp. IMUNJ 23232 TaxID=3376064 RepID=UPI0037A223F5